MSNIKVMRAWDKGRNKIAYVYRDPETGNTKIGEEKFINWFYLKLQDYEKYKGILLKFKSDGTILGFEKEHKYVKVFIEFNHNSELLNKDMEWVWEYKNFKNNEMFEKLKMMGIQTYEADVKAFKRWLLRDHVEIETEYKVLYYDIETDDRHSDALIPGKYRILSVAMKSSDDKNLDGKMMWIYTKEDTDEAEKEMLEKLASVINKHDVIISFNGSNFDDPYIKSRFVRYGIKIDWRKKFFQDQCWAMKKYGPSFSSYSLDNLSKNILKRGKVEHSGLRVWDMWKNNLKLLKEYNIEDVQLMYEMECKTGYLGSHREICAAGMCPVDDLYVSRKIDNFILKQAEEDGHYHFKTLEWQDENAESNDKTYEGAYVFPPVEGRHEHVRVVDFASLYPNVINTFNISPDTLIEDDENIPEDMIIKTPTRHRYRKDFIGILPKVVMRFADRRNYFKNLMSKETPGTVAHMVLNRKQYLYKYFGLSFYGCMGEKHSRAYDIRVAESITLCGQYFIKKCAEYLVKNNITINYGDSVTKERNTIIMVNGEVQVVSFEELYNMCDIYQNDRDKEIGVFSDVVETLSYNFEKRCSEWKPIKAVIRHKTNKKVYLYRYREGITKVTEDHSLIDENGNCFKPDEHFSAFSIPALAGKKIEIFNLSDYIQPYHWSKGGRTNKIVFGHDYIQFEKYNKTRFLTKVNQDNIIPLLRICAHYICNGSSSTIDTTNRFMFSIASQDIELLNQLKDDLSIFFPDSKIVVRHSDHGVNYKVVVANGIAAICFKQLCGQKYNGKKIPNFVYNLKPEYQRFFIREMMKGDGTITLLNNNKESYDFESASINVVSGLAYLLRLVGEKITCQTNGDKGTFTIKSRITDNIGLGNIKNVLKQVEYDDYVYDLSVADNNNFVDAMGNLLLHNTDSLFLANIPKHSHMKLIANKLTQLCDLHAKKYFNCDICTIKMEYDKGFKTFLIRDAKKRYAGVLDYLDGHAISEFNMYVAGFECKRTDSCQLLRDVQYKLLRMILEPQKCPDVNEIRSFIMKLKEDCFANRFTIEDITLSQRLTKEIDEYHGRQMHIMVAKEMMEDGKEVWLGDKIPYFIIGLDTNKKPIPKPVYKFEGRYCESYYWNNKIFPALMRVLQVVYPKIDWESYKAHGVGEVKVGKSLW